MVNVVPWDLPRHNIHHGASKAFSYNVIIIAFRTSKEGFLLGWVRPMDSRFWFRSLFKKRKNLKLDIVFRRIQSFFILPK